MPTPESAPSVSEWQLQELENLFVTAATDFRNAQEGLQQASDRLETALDGWQDHEITVNGVEEYIPRIYSEQAGFFDGETIVLSQPITVEGVIYSAAMKAKAEGDIPAPYAVLSLAQPIGQFNNHGLIGVWLKAGQWHITSEEAPEQQPSAPDPTSVD